MRTASKTCTPPRKRPSNVGEIAAAAGEAHDRKTLAGARSVAVDQADVERAVERGRANRVELAEQAAGGGPANFDRDRARAGLGVVAGDREGACRAARQVPRVGKRSSGREGAAVLDREAARWPHW